MANYTLVILILISSTLHNTNCLSRHQILNAVDGKFIKYRYLPLYNSFRDIRSNLFHKNYGQESLESYSTLYLTIRKRTCTHISPIVCISCDKFENNSDFCPTVNLYEKVNVNIIHNCMPLMKRISIDIKDLNCAHLNITHLSWTFG